MKFREVRRPGGDSDRAYGEFIFALERTAETGKAVETDEIPGTYYDTMMRRGFRLQRRKTSTGYAYWCEPVDARGDWRARGNFIIPNGKAKNGK